MARIRSEDTQPELAVRRALHAAGQRFRLHRRDLPGKPDIVLPRFRFAVFVHGCFWHGHGCGTRKAHVPKSNVGYWNPKIAGNIARDRLNQGRLRRLGWRCFVIWECQIEAGVSRLLRSILSSKG
jgi:DNA mismatch endonuclease, patch repair protein